MNSAPLSPILIIHLIINIIIINKNIIKYNNINNIII